MRTFVLMRHTDVSGISGTGLVAEGIEFDDGTVVVRWLKRREGPEPTTVVHPDINNVETLHGHGSSTEIVWLWDSVVLTGSGRDG